jgi:outer membrane protein OmpA-like peptidoglycan-associated protein
LLEKLSQRFKNENWDKADLAHFLEGEYNNIKTSISPELFDKINSALGLRSIQPTNRPKVSITPIERRERNVVENKSNYAGSTSNNKETEEESTPIAIPWKTMGVILGLGLLLAMAYWGFNEYKNRPVSTEPEEEMSASIVDSNSVKADTLNAQIDSTKQVTPPKEVMSSFGTNLENYLSDSTTKLGRTFVLTNVDFLGGTPELDETSTMVLEELTTLLKKYPASQIKLFGYANDGNQAMGNKTLSTKRVFAIKQKLIANGIDLLRINAIGLGDGVKRDSLNLNSADRGSRRIDMKVVKK